MLNQSVLADSFIAEKEGPLAAALVLGASLFIALCAQLSIHLPFTPVPLTGSTLGVLYVGALLGPRRGVAAVGLYLAMGAIGLPFYAGGAAGWRFLFGATGGYLIGFLPGAWLAGSLALRGWDRSPIKSAALMLVSSSVIFACGLSVLSFYVPKGEVLQLGLYPFLIGDLAKSLIASALLPLGWRFVGRR